MSVNVSGGSLDFVSTLDNSDFQAKSLQDLRAIRATLELTGDTSGITKYDEAVKAALATETKLRADLNNILVEAKVRTQELIQEIQKPAGKTVFSDSAAEVADYNANLIGLESGITVIEKLTADLADLSFEQLRLNAAVEAGSITQAEYEDLLGNNIVAQANLNRQIQTVSDAFAKNVVIENENIAVTEKSNVVVEQEIGILENLIAVLKQLNTQKLSIVDPAALSTQNKLIQETEADLARASNVGKLGFDEFGNKVKGAGVEVEGANGKIGKFESALNRVTNLSNIGATVVSRLSRQLIGLGVTFLSFYIGAKAIEALISWVQNLDYFSGRLDQAKQNFEALNETMADASKAAGSEIANVKALYETATDLNAALRDRVAAAQELKKERPDEFANSKISAILNGQEKKSFDDLTASILENAKADAARSKIGTLQGKTIDIDFTKEKIENARKSEIARVYGNSFSSAVSNVSTTDQIAAINDRAKASQKVQDQNRKIIQGQIDFLTSFAGGSSKIAASIIKSNKLIQDPLKDFDTILANASDKADLDNLKAALQAKLNALAPNDAQIAIYQAKIRQVEALEKQYSPKLTDGQAAAKADAASLKAKLALLQQVSDATDTFNRKGLSSDQAAIQAISDKFDQLRKKIATFNADPKNKNHQITSADISSLQGQENTAIDNQANLNENAYIQQDIDKKKKLYADYEEYKRKVGSDTANAQYADLLKSGKDFATYLNTIKASVDTADQSGPIQERAALTQKEIDANNEAQKKAFDNLLVQTATYHQQRQAIIEVGLDQEKQLNDKGLTEQANQVAKNTQDQLTALDEANFKKLESYKELFDGIEVLTRKQATDDINKLYGSAAGRLATGQLTPEAFLKIIKQLDQASLALKNSGGAQTLQEIGAAFGSIATEVGNVNTVLGSMIGTVGNTLAGLGKIEELQNTIKSKHKDGFSDFKTDLKDEISLYTTAATSVISIINTITSASAQRKAAAEAYYNSVIASQTQYNISLDDQLRLQEQLNGNLFLKDYKADIADASLALAKENVQFEASLAALQAGQAKTGQKNVVDGKSVLGSAASGALAGAVIAGPVGAGVGAVVGAIAGLFGSKKKVDVLGPLLGVYPDLIQKDKDGVDQFNESLAKNLIQNNLVSDSTKVLLQNTIDLNDARQAAIDQINSDIKDLAGSLGDDLRTALVGAFEAGTDASKAFGDSVSKVIENIVSQFLFQDIFGAEFDKLSANLKKSFSVTGDQNATDDLTQFFKDAGPLTAQYEAALKAAQVAGAANGLNLFPSTATTPTATSLTGAAITQSITEDSSTRLYGVFSGVQLSSNQIRDLNMQIVQQGTQSISLLTGIQVNTKRTADNLDVNLPAMLVALNSINKSSGDTSGAILRAAGKLGY